MKHPNPAFKPGWTMLGMEPIQGMCAEAQEALKEKGGQWTRKDKYKYILFENLGWVTPSGRILVFIYQRFRTSQKSKRRGCDA